MKKYRITDPARHQRTRDEFGRYAAYPRCRECGEVLSEEVMRADGKGWPRDVDEDICDACDNPRPLGRRGAGVVGLRAVSRDAASPATTGDEIAGDDAAWFGHHPKRRYRARDGLLIRRRLGKRRDIFLRTTAPPGCCAQTEAEVEQAWWMGAWPDLQPRERLQAMQRARRMTSPLEAALAFGSMGFHIMPCGPDKRPLTPHGFKDATAHLGMIGRWWCRWPDSTIGFWPGKSDIAVLDIDIKDGKNGLATLGQLDALPPPTPTVHTPSGGLHLHFRMPEKRVSITAGAGGRGIGVGLDWRGDGGYVILPTPGSGYRWGEWHYGNCALREVPIALLPRDPPATTPAPIGSSLDPEPFTPARIASILNRVARSPEGERNSVLFWGACRLGEAVRGGILGDTIARTLLAEAAAVCGLDRAGTDRTIASGFRRV